MTDLAIAQQQPTPDKKIDQTAQFKVMSFNIRFGTANDGDNHWKNRQATVVKAINNYAPDLLGTQETLFFQAEYLQDNLKDYEFVGWSREKDPKKGEQCSIFFRKDRFEKVDAGQFWLSETPDRKASKSWDSSLPRIATWVCLKDKKQDGRKLIFLNTHFDHRGPQARLESARLIRKWIEENHADTPVVITGDFNCDVGSKPYEVLLDPDTKLKLVDSYRQINAKPSKEDGTFNGFKGTKTGARIDWVLSTGQLEVQSAAIDRFNDQGRYPSDHCPVTATLKWKK
jgi:endonuclease/exonuclease/phosphatase family metal-dependent hydrolase